MMDKKILIVVVLTLVIFSSITLFYSGSLSSILNSGGKFVAKEKVFCKETDGGIDYYKKGATYGKSSNDEIYDNFDFCEDSETLYEWYCKGSEAFFERYKCPKDCSSGVCIT